MAGDFNMITRDFHRLVAGAALLGVTGCSYVVPLHHVPLQAPSTGDFARIEADRAAKAPPAYFNKGRAVRGNEESQFEGMVRYPEMALGLAATMAAQGGPGTIVVGIVVDQARLDLEKDRTAFRLRKQSPAADADQLASMLAGLNPENEGYRYTCSHDKDPEAAADLRNGAISGDQSVFRLCAWRGNYDPKHGYFVKPRDAAP